MDKPNVIRIGDRVRLDGTQLDALTYIVEKHGPIDNKGAQEMFREEFPEITVPPFFATLFAMAVKSGRIRKVSRGIFGAA